MSFNEEENSENLFQITHGVTQDMKNRVSPIIFKVMLVNDYSKMLFSSKNGHFWPKLERNSHGISIKKVQNTRKELSKQNVKNRIYPSFKGSAKKSGEMLFKAY